MTNEHPWRKRQEFPDAQIRDAADQFEAARELLEAEPPGSGVLLPLMNAAATAIELYLKCLAAELVYTSDKHVSGMHVVTAASLQKGHKLVALFDKISDNDRQDLERAFAVTALAGAESFRSILEKCEGAFMASRYPFESGVDVSKYSLDILFGCSAFLREYVAGVPQRDRIEGRRSAV